MRRFLLIGIFVASSTFARAAAGGGAGLRETSGLVQVRPEGADRWRPAGAPPRRLAPGDAVRTGFNARAVLSLDGGAVVEAGANTQLALDETVRGGERGETDLAGRHEPTQTPTPARARREDFASRMRRELAHEREADALQN